MFKSVLSFATLQFVYTIALADDAGSDDVYADFDMEEVFAEYDAIDAVLGGMNDQEKVNYAVGKLSKIEEGLERAA